MTTEPSTNVQDAYDVSVTTDATDLLTMMRAVNGTQEDRTDGVLWWLHTGAAGSGRLIAGVRGERGVLVWAEPKQTFLPRNGINEEDVDYFTWESHHFPQRPGTEVPIDLVYQAVREYVATEQRPTCLEWVPAPDAASATA